MIRPGKAVPQAFYWLRVAGVMDAPGCPSAAVNATNLHKGAVIEEMEARRAGSMQLKSGVGAGAGSVSWTRPLDLSRLGGRLPAQNRDCGPRLRAKQAEALQRRRAAVPD